MLVIGDSSPASGVSRSPAIMACLFYNKHPQPTFAATIAVVSPEQPDLTTTTSYS